MTSSENTGDHSKIIRILQKNPAIGGNVELAKKIAEQGELRRFEKGEVLISFGDNDDHVFFILSGIVDIKVPNLDIKQRTAPNQVGEMTAMKPEIPRSATVSAKTEHVEAISISGAQFREHADLDPQFRNRLADEMDNRHRQRLVSVTSKPSLIDRPSAWLAVCSIIGFVVATLIFWALSGPQFGRPIQLGISAVAGAVIFAFIYWHNPNFFYRKLLLVVVGWGFIDANTNFVLDFNGTSVDGLQVLKIERMSQPYDFVPWAILAVILLVADFLRNWVK